MAVRPLRYHEVLSAQAARAVVRDLIKQMMDASIQLALSISVPTMAVLIGILINNSRLGDLNSRFSDLNSRFGDLRAEMNSRFDNVDRRFDDMKDMWRSELHRIEEVLDPRLKHLEDR